MRFANRNFLPDNKLTIVRIPMLHLPSAVYLQLRQQGEAAYPLECCGVLLGHFAAEGKIVHQAILVPNVATTPRNRYEIAPLDLIRAERDARGKGLEVVGFYHSHPDHPARWSATDLAEAHWLGCSYVITAVYQGQATDTNAFHLAGSSEETKRFHPEEIVLLHEPPNLSQNQSAVS